MAGHGWQWQAMAGHGLPWPVMALALAGHGHGCVGMEAKQGFTKTRFDMRATERGVGHGRPWLAVAGHGRPWPAIAGLGCMAMAGNVFE